MILTALLLNKSSLKNCPRRKKTEREGRVGGGGTQL
jgi:hypothetical protein